MLAAFEYIRIKNCYNTIKKELIKDGEHDTVSFD